MYLNIWSLASVTALKILEDVALLGRHVTGACFEIPKGSGSVFSLCITFLDQHVNTHPFFHKVMKYNSHGAISQMIYNLLQSALPIVCYESRTVTKTLLKFEYFGSPLHTFLCLRTY